MADQMKNHSWINYLVAALLSTLLNVYAMADDVVIIINKENRNPIDRALVIKIYTGAARGWEDGTPILAFDLDEARPAREEFYTKIIGKSRGAIRAIWAQNIFTGKGLPPKVANPDVEMKKIVKANINAIGYIRSSSADESVKVVKPF
jgi:ABC-type phosphate transport system substrate-binding protein